MWDERFLSAMTLITLRPLGLAATGRGNYGLFRLPR